MGLTELKSFGNRLAVQFLFRNLSISFGFKFCRSNKSVYDHEVCIMQEVDYNSESQPENL